VVSHAGAGSVFEALGGRRPLLVVVNETLMDNHQAWPWRTGARHATSTNAS
jgi:UDP-N-acetylglucosamine transferase subunit ALG13